MLTETLRVRFLALILSRDCSGVGVFLLLSDNARLPHPDCSLSFKAASSLAPQVSCREFETEFIAPSPSTDLADFPSHTRPRIPVMPAEVALQMLTEVCQTVFHQLSGRIWPGSYRACKDWVLQVSSTRSGLASNDSSAPAGQLHSRQPASSQLIPLRSFGVASSCLVSVDGLRRF